MKLRFEQCVDLDRQSVFDFHRTPRHLAVLLREWPTFRLLHHADSIHVGAETWVEETVCKCIPVVMGFRHIVHEPPHRFGEELIHGPFKQFVHIHEFEEAGDHRTIVRDRLDCRLDWPYGGEAATRLIAARRIRAAFEFRHRALVRLIEDGTVQHCAKLWTRETGAASI